MAAGYANLICNGALKLTREQRRRGNFSRIRSLYSAEWQDF
jgi:hypothetical protein